jgi:glycosyltransferase involved in cell wall biosynthesis
MPTFSVIIPAYNSENFISQTIESVLNQTYKDFELIIVDDGSKDSTRKTLESYRDKDSRIKVIFTPNSGGPTTPTNIGLNLATGTYIAFLDHDDIWKETKLEALLREYEANPDAGFILSNVEIFFENENRRVHSKARSKKKKLPVPSILAGKYFNTFSALSVRNNILSRVGSLDTNLFVFADYDIIVRLVSFGVPHLFLNESLATYRIHGKNASALEATAERRISDLERIVTKYKKIFEQHPKSLAAVYQAIGSLYLYLNKKELARKYYWLAITCRPLNISMYLRLIVTFLRGLPYRAIVTLKKKALRYLN